MFSKGALAAIAAALLFGASTPLAKQLLGDVQPWRLASLLYLGSGLGLTLYAALRAIMADRRRLVGNDGAARPRRHLRGDQRGARPTGDGGT